MRNKSLPTLALALVVSSLTTGCHFWQAAGAFGLGTFLGDALSSELLDDVEPGTPVAPPPPVLIIRVPTAPPPPPPSGGTVSPCEGHPGNHLPAWCR